MSVPRFLIAVHGGAGRLARRKLEEPGRTPLEQGIVRALTVGENILKRGGKALRAVTAAVAVLEDDGLFNAGKGAALCHDGTVELSASLMDGRMLRTGAMVGMKRTRNPILAARALLNHQHGLLFGEAADQFAEAAKLEMVAPEYFLTPHRQKQWRRARDQGKIELDHSDGEGTHGTVGAVARDAHGNLAAATSTGGLVNQLRGRVGDTPIVGSGTWADNHTAAISATGKGDAFSRIAFARRVADLIELRGMDPSTAASQALDELRSIGGIGGCIVIDHLGQFSASFNSPQMVRGYVDSEASPKVGILPTDWKPITPNTLAVAS